MGEDAAQGSVAEAVGGIPLSEIGRRQHERQQRHRPERDLDRAPVLLRHEVLRRVEQRNFCVDKVGESASVARGCPRKARRCQASWGILRGLANSARF